MLKLVKQFITLKSIDKLISDKNYDLALEKLNFLIQNGLYLNDAYFKRGLLCHKLLMNEDAYSDFTYVISHSNDNFRAYVERMYLNFEILNFQEAISDSEYILNIKPDMFDAYRIKFLALLYTDKTDESKDYLYLLYNNKFKSVQFLLNEASVAVTKDEFANALKILQVLDLIDKDNPMKLLNEANIYGLVGNEAKQNEILQKIDSVFPKYFISHFKFSDIYEEKDLLEICFLLELKVFDKRNLFEYPMMILEGYKANIESRITDSKECFEKAIEINPNKPEAYVLLGETLQIMSGYDNTHYQKLAKENYQKALEIYEKEDLVTKAESMKRQIQHLNSGLIFKQ